MVIDAYAIERLQNAMNSSGLAWEKNVRWSLFHVWRENGFRILPRWFNGSR
jgi:hypothetical protein